MATPDIENKTYSELKAERDALIEQAKGEEVPVLAVRYIKALTDAKHRDEVMGEQGKTITALQDGLEAAKQVQAESKRLLAGAAESINALTAASVQDLDNVRALQAQLTAETGRANRLKALAMQNQTAITGAAKLLNDAITASQVDAADNPGQ